MINKQRVRRIKTLIYAIIILVLLTPLIVSIVMFARVSSLSKQVDALKTAVSSQPASLPARGSDGGYVIEPEGQALVDSSKPQDNAKDQADAPSASEQSEAGGASQPAPDDSEFLNTLSAPAVIPDDPKQEPAASQPQGGDAASQQSANENNRDNGAGTPQQPAGTPQPVTSSQTPLTSPQSSPADNPNDNARTGAAQDESAPVKTEPDEIVNLYKPKNLPGLRFDTIVTPLPAKKNTLYFSFDNITPPQADQLVDLLEKHGAKATFFVWWDSEGDKDTSKTLRKIVESGHSIGIYTDANPRLYDSRDAFLVEFSKIFDLVEAATGKKTRLYRMPIIAKSDGKFIRQADLSDIQEELDARGFLQYGWKSSAQNAAKLTGGSEAFRKKIGDSILRDGHAVISFNDHTDDVLSCLDDLIAGYKARGYGLSAINYDTVPVSQIDE